MGSVRCEISRGLGLDLLRSGMGRGDVYGTDRVGERSRGRPSRVG